MDLYAPYAARLDAFVLLIFCTCYLLLRSLKPFNRTYISLLPIAVYRELPPSVKLSALLMCHWFTRSSFGAAGERAPAPNVDILPGRPARPYSTGSDRHRGAPPTPHRRRHLRPPLRRHRSLLLGYRMTPKHCKLSSCSCSLKTLFRLVYILGVAFAMFWNLVMFYTGHGAERALNTDTVLMCSFARAK